MFYGLLTPCELFKAINYFLGCKNFFSEISIVQWYKYYLLTHNLGEKCVHAFPKSIYA